MKSLLKEALALCFCGHYPAPATHILQTTGRCRWSRFEYVLLCFDIKVISISFLQAEVKLNILFEVELECKMGMGNVMTVS